MRPTPAPSFDVASKSPFFAGIAPRDLKSILKAATPRRFFANSVVIHQGDEVRNLYLLTEGRARYFFVTPEGTKILFTLVMPGELFGFATLVASLNFHLVNVEMLTNSRALSWDRKTIRDIARRHTRLFENGLTITAGYIDWLIAAHIGLACHSAQLRLAQTLINLSRDVGSTGESGVELAVTNEELAHAASLTTFTVSRLIQKWHRSGAVSKSRRKILLRFPKQLFENIA
jgi:CRP/FNR family cyclic AMP-dependent transcriptional regulator